MQDMFTCECGGDIINDMGTLKCRECGSLNGKWRGK